MARVTHVTKARKAKGKRVCRYCGKEINVGDSYDWAQNNQYSPQIISCGGPNCQIKQSDLEGNPKKASLMRITEAIQETLKSSSESRDQEAVATQLETSGDEAESVADEYDEALSNMPEQLQQAGTGENLQEQGEAVREWSEKLKEAAEEVRAVEADDTDCTNCGQDEGSHPYYEPGTHEFHPGDGGLCAECGQEEDVPDHLAACDDYSAPDWWEEVEKIVDEVLSELTIM